jgi:phosphonate transport system substrate-binding protein
MAGGISLALASAVPAIAAEPSDCPNGGTVRFGVEPYDTAARLVPIYKKVGELIGEKLGEKLGCKVEVFVATSYNAEIEAMRNGKLEIGEFGPLGYVLAHQVAKAEAVAAFGTADGKPDTYWASIVSYPGSDIKTVADIKGHSFAFSDPASTSGHLFPAYGLRKAGLDPDKDVRAIYAGSHTSSFEALYNHKVDAGELNSEQLESAKQRGHYKMATWCFYGNRTRSRPTHSWCAAICPRISRSGSSRCCRISISRPSIRRIARSWSVPAQPGWCRRPTARMTASATSSKRSTSTLKS